MVQPEFQSNRTTSHGISGSYPWLATLGWEAHDASLNRLSGMRILVVRASAECRGSAERRTGWNAHALDGFGG